MTTIYGNRTSTIISHDNGENITYYQENIEKRSAIIKPEQSLLRHLFFIRKIIFENPSSVFCQ